MFLGSITSVTSLTLLRICAINDQWFFEHCMKFGIRLNILQSVDCNRFTKLLRNKLAYWKTISKISTNLKKSEKYH